MKKVLLTFALVGAFAGAQAQLSAGRMAIGGTVGFSTGSSTRTTNNTSTDGPKTSSYSFIPRFAYLITDKIEVGIGVGITGDSNESTTPSNTVVKTTNSAFILNPYARYYSMLRDNFGFFAQVGLDLSTGTSKTETTTNNITTEGKSDITKMSFGINPGIIYFLNDRISLESSIGFFGYTMNSSKSSTTEDKNSDFGLNVSSTTLNFGFRYYFGGAAGTPTK